MVTATIAQLRAIKTPGTTTKYCLPEHENYIAWQYDPLDKTTPDDGKTCIVTSTGKRIKKKMIINIVAANSGTGTPSTSTGSTVTPNPPSWIGVSPFNDTANTATFIPSSGYAVTEHEYRYKFSGGAFSSWITATSNVINLPASDIDVGGLELRVKSATGRNASSVITNSVAFTAIPDMPPTVISATTTSSITVEVVFSETIPSATISGYSFKKNGSGLAAASVSGSGDRRTFTVGAMNAGDNVTFSYSSPSSGKTLDAGGNELGNFTDRAITNTLGASIEVFPNLTNVSLSVTAPGDTTFNPSFFGTASSGAPIITEYTRTAASGETVILTGHNFTSGTTFTCYSKTTTGTATVQSMDVTRQMAIITLPNLGAWSTFLISAQNSIGRGEPVLINKTEVTWIEDRGVAGQTISVFGKNLSSSFGTTTSNVYLKNASTGAITSCTEISVNPHRIEYTVPAVSTGNYEVWVHNGHGGVYGWSKSPTNLTVWAGHVWSGANNTPTLTNNSNAASTANTSAINTALSTGASMRTVNIGAGKFYINGSLTAGWETRLKGAGKELTEIIISPTTWPTGNNLFATSTPNVLYIEDLTLTVTSNYSGSDSTHLLPFNNNEWLVLNNVKINAKGFNFAVTNGRSYIYLNNCDFTGKAWDFLQGRQIFVKGCNFYQTNDTRFSMTGWGSREVSITDCTFQDLSSASDEQGVGRIFTGNGNWDGARDYYFGNNTGTGLGPRDGTDMNMGEAFMFEGALTRYKGSPSSSTVSTVTFSSGTIPPKSDSSIFYAIVMKGKGYGQIREVNSINTTSRVVSLKENWKVQPDATSVIYISGGVRNVTIYNNTVTGKAGLSTQGAGTAQSLACPFGNCYDWTVDNNMVTDYRQGILNFSTQHADNMHDPNLWQFYLRNDFIDTRSPIGFYAIASEGQGITESMAIATVVRDNTTTGTIGEDARYQLPTSSYSNAVPIVGVVWENNSFEGPVPNCINTGDETNPASYVTPAAGTIANEVYT